MKKKIIPQGKFTRKTPQQAAFAICNHNKYEFVLELVEDLQSYLHIKKVKSVIPNVYS